MLTHDGYIAESTGSNIFFKMKDGNVHTPTPDSFLNGITRQTVISLLEKEGMKVIERTIDLNELKNVEECFLTGTAAEVSPVGKIGEFEFKPGEFCSKSIKLYSEFVR